MYRTSHRSVYDRLYRAKQVCISDDANGDNEANLLAFPPEIFEQFFVRLTVDDFFIVLLVCKVWRKIALSGFNITLGKLSTWSRLEDVGPMLIHGHTITPWISPYEEKKFYLYGGWSPAVGVNNSLHCFVKEGSKILWGIKPENVMATGPCVFAHSAAVVGNGLYIFGGSNGSDKYSNDMYCIDLVKMYCAKITPNGTVPSPRAYHRAAVIGKKIIIFGGQMTVYRNCNNKTPLWYNDVHTFDTETNTWERIETQGESPPPCGAGTLLVFNETNLIYFGGGQWKKFVNFPEDIQYYNDTYKLDTLTWTWSKLSVKGIPPCPRAGHAGAFIGKYLLITGGYVTVGPTWPTYQDSFLLDLETLEWEKSNNIEEKMGNHVMVIDDNVIHLVGGTDYDSSLTSHVYTANFSEMIIKKTKKK